MLKYGESRKQANLAVEILHSFPRYSYIFHIDFYLLISSLLSLPFLLIIHRTVHSYLPYILQ